MSKKRKPRNLHKKHINQRLKTGAFNYVPDFFRCNKVEKETGGPQKNVYDTTYHLNENKKDKKKTYE